MVRCYCMSDEGSDELRFEPLGIQVYDGIYADYLYDPGRLASVFPLDPRDPGAWWRRADEVDGPSSSARRRELAAELAGYNSYLGAAGIAVMAARRLGQPGALAVVAGQQAGLLTGPLLTIYKAVTAIRLAAAWEQALGRPVVPVFWAATEDHDYAEINHVYFPGPDGPLRLALDAPAGPRCSAGNLPLPGDAPAFLEALSEILPESQYRGEALALARSALEEAASFGEWFCRLMAALLGQHGLVVIDPMRPVLRQLAAPLLVRAAEHGRGVMEDIGRGAGSIAALGYDSVLDLEEGHSGIFCYHQGERLALFHHGEMVQTRDGKVRIPAVEWRRRIEAAPYEFSPNVALRPLVQDYLLPTLAQVAGPGEVAYLAQLGPLYAALEVGRPVIYPRLGATVVEPGIGRILDRYEISPAMALGELDAARARALAAVEGLDLAGLFDRQRERIAAGYRELIRTLGDWDSGLAGLGEENLGRILAQVSYLEDKARQRSRQKNATVTRHFRLIGTHLKPGGRLQERVFNAFWYLARYGTRYLDGLVKGAPLAERHQVLWLEGDGI